MHRAVPILCASLLFACNGVLGLGKYEYVDTPPDAGEGSDAAGTDSLSGDASGEGSQACKLAGPPRRSATEDTGGVLTFTFATRAVDFGDGPTGAGRPDGGKAYLSIGYDLDGRCKSAGDPPTCTNGFRSGPLEDGADGIDNAAGELVASIKSKYPAFGSISSEHVNEDVDAGIRPPLAMFRIRGYNGYQEDDHVDVDWYLPLLPNPKDAGGVDAAVPPKWDGTDVWPTEPLVGSPVSRISIAGYVSNYKLVARFVDSIAFRFSYLTTTLFDATLYVEIEPHVMPKPYEFHNGLITGRTPRRDIFADVPQMSALLTGFPVCMDSGAVYADVRSWLCSFPDMTSTSLDGALPRCDMLSLGLAFQPARANVGPPVQVPPLPALCPPDADPVNETCEPPEGGVAP